MATNSGHSHSGQTHSGLSNVRADHLSWLNQPITTERSLHPEIVNWMFGTWRTPTVDMFVTVYNMHLPQFMSPISGPRALAIDALSQDWQGKWMFMFPLPPPPPAQQSHSETRDHPGGRSDTNSPLVASQPWFPHLQHLCVDHPLFLPYLRDLLSQQGYVSEGKSYRLPAWSTTKTQHF